MDAHGPVQPMSPHWGCCDSREADGDMSGRMVAGRTGQEPDGREGGLRSRQASGGVNQAFICLSSISSLWGSPELSSVDADPLSCS